MRDRDSLDTTPPMSLGCSFPSRNEQFELMHWCSLKQQRDSPKCRSKIPAGLGLHLGRWLSFCGTQSHRPERAHHGTTSSVEKPETDAAPVPSRVAGWGGRFSRLFSGPRGQPASGQVLPSGPPADVLLRTHSPPGPGFLSVLSPSISLNIYAAMMQCRALMAGSGIQTTAQAFKA